MPDIATSSSMIRFTSVYEHSVDDKRRVPVPFRWRPKDPLEFTLMVFPSEEGHGEYLRVLPPSQWLKLLEEIKGMPSDNEQKPILQRIVARDSLEVRLDSAGRITIPEGMATRADITDTAILSGALGHFELWSPARHKKVEEKDQPEKVHVLKRVRAL